MSGAKPRNYKVLTNNSLQACEMGKELDISRRTAELRRCALLKFGYAKHKPLVPHEDNCKLILDALSKPMNYAQLQRRTGLENDVLHIDVNLLKKKGEIYEFRLCARMRGKSAYSSFDLFGNMANKHYFYKPGQEKAVANLITKNLCLEELVQSKGMRTSLTQRLRDCLPDSIFARIHEKYNVKNLYAVLER
ncbi:MAG: hypothetical protein V1839_03230 [archaeon]